tara:strand:- start:4026 stop:5756 length:1731 start_codon:yes stop_codon:yes gene_type:complete
MLKNFKIFFGIFLFTIYSPLKGEEKIDIWKTKQADQPSQNQSINSVESKNKIKINPSQKIDTLQSVKIEDANSNNENDQEVFGIYDPADYNFNLNMWSATKADDVRASLKRIKKIKLSQTSNDILENILMSFSYPPQGMEEEEFVNLKVEWLIKNNRLDLIEKFLKQNKEFKSKSRAVQFLVDANIAKANIKEGCEKIKFIDSTIKDSYLEKFKIYCLVFNKKNSEAQLLLDLLREQNQSDKFFDDKINFLLGISSETSSKINEKNLLNFYLSSVTIKDFKYTPTEKTKKQIWKYLNAANLIKIEDVNDKEKIKGLEIAANQGQLDEKIIFDIYKQIPFNLNNLINAKNIYQTLDESDARALIYQKFLLSEDVDSKVEYLFILNEIFSKSDLKNVFSNILSDNLKAIGLNNIPENYQEVAIKSIKDEASKIGKVKYNDKILHQSKIIKFYLEKEEEKKIQKDIDKIFKKIAKNKKYFYSAKDLALVDALIKDGFSIPQNFNKKEFSNKYEVPKNLIQLIKKEQNAFLALKIVEIIGEDEPYQLDPETIYFITNLLNKTNLIQIRNIVLSSALPLRV